MSRATWYIDWDGTYTSLTQAPNSQCDGPYTFTEAKSIVRKYISDRIADDRAKLAEVRKWKLSVTVGGAE